jgi:hypothetical protein
MSTPKVGDKVMVAVDHIGNRYGTVGEVVFVDPESPKYPYAVVFEDDVELVFGPGEIEVPS